MRQRHINLLSATSLTIAIACAIFSERSFYYFEGVTYRAPVGSIDCYARVGSLQFFVHTRVMRPLGWSFDHSRSFNDPNWPTDFSISLTTLMLFAAILPLQQIWKHRWQRWHTLVAATLFAAWPVIEMVEQGARADDRLLPSLVMSLILSPILWLVLDRVPQVDQVRCSIRRLLQREPHEWGRQIANAIRRLRGLNSRRAHRIQRELCPECGYDIRASSDRCPECGTPIDPRRLPPKPLNSTDAANRLAGMVATPEGALPANHADSVNSPINAPVIQRASKNVE